MRTYFPQPDIPVLQLSIHSGAPLTYHMKLRAMLSSLRHRASSSWAAATWRKLRMMNRAYGDSGFDWAERFDAHVRDVMTTGPAELAEVAKDPDCALVVPTAEHFLPLAYIAGMAAASGERPQAFSEGKDTQSLPERVPPEQTNT